MKISTYSDRWHSPNGFGDITKRVDSGSADGFFVSLEQLQQFKTNPHPLPGRHIFSTPKIRTKSQSKAPGCSLYDTDRHCKTNFNMKFYFTDLSAILPTRSIQFSCTFSCLFFKMGVKRGSRSLIGGVILCIPATKETEVSFSQS